MVVAIHGQAMDDDANTGRIDLDMTQLLAVLGMKNALHHYKVLFFGKVTLALARQTEACSLYSKILKCRDQADRTRVYEHCARCS